MRNLRLKFLKRKKHILRRKIQKLWWMLHKFKQNLKILAVLCLMDVFLKKPLDMLYDVSNVSDKTVEVDKEK